MTFNLRVTNNGSAPAQAASLTDSYSTYVDLLSVNTSKGTATTNASLRSFAVNIGTLMPRETAVITVVVTVNSTTRTNQNLTNTARFTYAFGGLTYTVNSSVSYRLIGSTTLPNTGGLQLQQRAIQAEPGSAVCSCQEAEPRQPLAALARWSALLLGG
jgi:hypothetical protein